MPESAGLSSLSSLGRSCRAHSVTRHVDRTWQVARLRLMGVAEAASMLLSFERPRSAAAVLRASAPGRVRGAATSSRTLKTAQ